MILLIVDDQPQNLAVLQAQLAGAGHQVLKASDGVEALTVLAHHTVDAVISDALMPNMDGFQLCLELRQKAELRHLPFVLYTSTYDSPSDRSLATEVGADAYVVKPAPTATLLAELSHAFEAAASREHRAPPASDHLGVFKRYNAALVAKLEEKNAALAAANTELRRREERYHGTLDRMLEGCQILSPEFRYLYLNDTAAAHGGRSRSELLGRTLQECYPGFDQTETFAVMQRCLTRREGARIETEFARVDGEKMWFELSVQPVPEGIFILSLDITERVRSTRQIQDQLDELLRWQEVMLNREDRIQALKAEVNELLRELGRPDRYHLPPAA